MLRRVPTLTAPKCLIVLALLLGVSGSSSAPAQVLQRNFWTVDGRVDAMAISNGTIYLGGDFTRVGPPTGAFAAIDKTSGIVQEPYAGVSGGFNQVNAVASDGHGGWYIGGNFSTVQGEARRCLAQIDANGRVTSWSPRADFGVNAVVRVHAIAVHGDTVYVGGNFGSVGTRSRNFLAAIDAHTGEATGWNPNPDARVWSILVQGDIVYVGGDFNQVGGQIRHKIAAIDAKTGLATSWNPNVTTTFNEFPQVFALAIDGNTIFAGGVFTHIGVSSRRCLAAIDVNTGQATSFNAQLTDYNQVHALLASSGILYVGGYFASIGGQPRVCLGALDPATGLATSWDPSPDGTVSAIAKDGTTLYVGGGFNVIGGEPRNFLAGIDAATGAVKSWNPNPHDYVLGIAVSGGAVCAGGYFRIVGGVTRNYIAAINAATGRPTDWDPNADWNVRTLTQSGGLVYAGGQFTNIGGQPRNYLAALDTLDGSATAWDPSLNAPARSIAVMDSTVYVAGQFGLIGSDLRSGLAAIDASTGLATSWDPSPNSYVVTLAVNGNTIYAGGIFTNIGGQPRNHVAALDATTGLATSWDPNADNSIDAFLVDGGTIYVGGEFTSIGGQSRLGIAALDAATGLATNWNPLPEDPQSLVYGLARSGNTLYVGGEFGAMGGKAHQNLTALDLTTAQATSWYPNVADGQVNTLVVNDGTVYAGGLFYSVIDTPYSYFCALSEAMPVGIASPDRELPLRLRAAPNPFRAGVALSFALSERQDVKIHVYDPAGRRVRELQNGPLAAGEQRVFWDGRNDGGVRVSEGIYVVRVSAGSYTLNTKVVSLR